MNEIDAIESLIQPLLDAQTALVQHKIEEGDPENGGQVKIVNDLIRSRDQAHDNLVAAIRATERPKHRNPEPASAPEHNTGHSKVPEEHAKPTPKPDEPDGKAADKPAEEKPVGSKGGKVATKK